MIQLSATRCSCIAIFWVSLVSFATITLCVASQRVFIVVSAYFVIDSVRKLLDTPSLSPNGRKSIVVAGLHLTKLRYWEMWQFATELRPTLSGNSAHYVLLVVMRLEMFKAIKSHIAVSWVTAPCVHVVGIRRWKQHGPPKLWCPITSLRN
jgi:hypothetical protein